MNGSRTDVDAVAAWLRCYLLEHPNAADTLEGVAAWWLSGNPSGPWLATVQAAVDRLVAAGEAVKRILPDGTTIYERNKRAGHGECP
jgi:hypothetical protein